MTFPEMLEIPSLENVSPALDPRRKLANAREMDAQIGLLKMDRL